MKAARAAVTYSTLQTAALPGIFVMEPKPTFYLWEKPSIIGGEYDTESEPIGEPNLGAAPRCPACKRYIGGRPWLPPYRLRLVARGRAGIGDVAYDAGAIFLSERFRKGFQESCLTGLKFTPAEIVKVGRPKRLSPVTVGELFFAEIARGNAAIDIARSQMEFGPVECQTCRTMRQIARAPRIVIEDGTWDGLDVFIARGFFGTPIVTDRFVNPTTLSGGAWDATS